MSFSEWLNNLDDWLYVHTDPVFDKLPLLLAVPLAGVLLVGLWLYWACWARWRS